MPGLIRFVMRLGATSEQAADAAQSAFVEAYLHWAQIKAPVAWLRTVATRIYLRQSPLYEELAGTVPDQVGSLNPLEALILKEGESMVYAALGRLPLRQRQVMAWHLDGFTHVEIAECLGIAEDAVRQNYARARAALKRSLGLTKAGE